MMNTKQSFKDRLRNYGFWVSLFALIPLFLQTFGSASILPENYEEITNLILSILVALGIANNPTTGKWYITPHEKQENLLEEEK